MLNTVEEAVDDFLSVMLAAEDAEAEADDDEFEEDDEDEAEEDEDEDVVDE